MKKRILSVICVSLTAALTLTACGGSTTSSSTTSSNSSKNEEEKQSVASQESSAKGEESSTTSSGSSQNSNEQRATASQESSAEDSTDEFDGYTYFDTVNGCDFYGSYVLLNTNGEKCIGFYVKNNNSTDCVVGMNMEGENQEGKHIGSSSAYIPLLGAGETGFIYAATTNDEASSWIHFDVIPTDTTISNEEYSLSSSYSRKDGYIQIDVTNLSTQDYLYGEITVIYHTGDSSPDVVSTGMIYNPDTDEIGLEPAMTDDPVLQNKGYVYVPCPDEFESYIDYYVSVASANYYYTATSNEYTATSN